MDWVNTIQMQNLLDYSHAFLLISISVCIILASGYIWAQLILKSYLKKLGDIKTRLSSMENKIDDNTTEINNIGFRTSNQ